MPKAERKQPTRLPFTSKPYRGFALAVGQLVLTWNDLHEKLGFLFSAALSQCGREFVPGKFDMEYIVRQADILSGVWSSAPFDRGKRELFAGALTETLAEEFSRFPSFIADIRWILGEANTIEDIRNNAVHTPFQMGGHPEARTVDQIAATYGMQPNVYMKNKRALGVLKHSPNKNLLREIRWARDAVETLRAFTHQISLAVTYAAPWPHRPRLPNRGQKSARSRARAKAQ
jgi:hypothetical protein